MLFARAAVFTVTLIVGMATRKAPTLFPVFVQLYGGDTLYATMWVQIAAGLAFLERRPTIAIRAACQGLAVCVVIELSQAVNVGWLNAIRATTGGGLVLGHGFLWSDLVCYAAGALLGWAIERGFAKWAERRVNPAQQRRSR